MDISDLTTIIVSFQIGIVYPLFLAYTCNLLGGI